MIRCLYRAKCPQQFNQSLLAVAPGNTDRPSTSFLGFQVSFEARHKRMRSVLSNREPCFYDLTQAQLDRQRFSLRSLLIASLPLCYERSTSSLPLPQRVPQCTSGIVLIACLPGSLSLHSNMGLQRRKVNQLAEAESKAAEEIAASHQQRQHRPPVQQRNPLLSYLTTVVLACAFWIIMQALYKYAAHLA